MQGASLVFVGYGSEGYNLYRMPFDPSAWRPMERPSQPLAAEPAAKPLPERPYNSFALLAPPFLAALSDSRRGRGLLSGG